MAKTRLRMAAISAVVFGVLGVLGWKIGIVIGEAYTHRATSERAANRADAVLHNTSGIRIGDKFPDLELWRPDGGGAAVLTELLPSGGGLLYLSPSCESCIKTSLMFDAWLKNHRRGPRAGIIVTDNMEATSSFVKLLHDSLVTLPVYSDVTQALRREHGLMENLAFFLISGDSLKLQEAGVWDATLGFVASKE